MMWWSSSSKSRKPFGIDYLVEEFGIGGSHLVDCRALIQRTGLETMRVDPSRGLAVRLVLLELRAPAVKPSTTSIAIDAKSIYIGPQSSSH